MPKRRLPDLTPTTPRLPPVESKYLSRWPAIVSAVGPTGSSKTHTLLGLIKLLRREGTITKLYVLCPSVKSNAVYTAVLKDTDWVFENVTNAKEVYATIDEITEDANAIADKWQEQMEWLLALREFKEGKPMNNREESLLDTYGYTEIALRRPGFCMLLDDCAHSPLLARQTSKANKFPNHVLACRHIPPQIGMSIFLIGQNTRCIPKILRDVTTHLFAFRTANEQEIKNYWLDSECTCSYEAFKDYFLSVTSEKYGYLFVDTINRTLTNSF
jgi:hypothetical protein